LNEIFQPVRAARNNGKTNAGGKIHNVARGDAAPHLRPTRGKFVVAPPGYTIKRPLYYKRQLQERVSAPLSAVIKPSEIGQPEICRLRLAPASGISAVMELWPSG
jgi:hypothetical protein